MGGWVGRVKIPQWVAQGLLVLGLITVLALNWPGQMSYDSVMQLADGRSGHYDSWHPVVMAWLLGLFDALLAGPGLFLAFLVLLVGSAWFTLLRLGRPGIGAALALILIFLTPQLVLYQGTIWKDVLFADAAIAAFVALAAAAAYWEKTPARAIWLGLSALLLCLAALARQNGFLLLPFAALSLGAIAARKTSWRMGWYYGLGLIALSLVLLVLANFALNFRSDGGEGARAQFRLALIYDLVGAARLDPGIRFSALEEKAPRLDAAIREQGVPLYSARLVDTLETASGLQAEIGQTPLGVIFAAWRRLVLNHPGLYLKVRWPVFGWVVAPSDPLACHPDLVGVDGPKEVLATLGLQAHIRPQDRFLYFYVARFVGTPVLAHLAFAALALLFLVLLARRGDGPDLAIAGLLAASLLFGLSFFVIAIACDYRYLYFLDMAAMTGALRYASCGAKPSSPGGPPHKAG